MNKCSSPKD